MTRLETRTRRWTRSVLAVLAAAIVAVLAVVALHEAPPQDEQSNTPGGGFEGALESGRSVRASAAPTDLGNRAQAAGQLHVLALDTSGKRVAGLEFRLEATAGRASGTSTARTGVDGSCMLAPALPAVLGRLSLHDAHHAWEPQQVGLRGEGSASVVALVLPTDGRISGRVLDTVGRPLAGARVGLKSTGSVVAAGPDGRFEIRGPAAMRDSCWADAPGYARLEIELPPRNGAGERQLDFRLVPAATARGSVVDAATGAAIAGCRIFAAGGSGDATELSSADGTFHVSCGSAAGSYSRWERLVLEHPDYATHRHGVFFGTASEVHCGVIALDRGCAIVGTALQAGGDAAYGALVFGQAAECDAMANCDEHGQFEMRMPSNTDIWLRLVGRGSGESAHLRMRTLDAGQRLDVGETRLAGGHEMLLQVVDDRGQPVPSAGVAQKFASTEVMLARNGSGVFSVLWLPGSTLRIQAPGFNPVVQEIWPRDLAQEVISVVLLPERWIQGRLAWPPGQRSRDVLVEFFGPGDALPLLQLQVAEGMESWRMPVSRLMAQVDDPSVPLSLFIAHGGRRVPYATTLTNFTEGHTDVGVVTIPTAHPDKLVALEADGQPLGGAVVLPFRANDWGRESDARIADGRGVVALHADLKGELDADHWLVLDEAIGWALLDSSAALARESVALPPGRDLWVRAPTWCEGGSASLVGIVEELEVRQTLARWTAGPIARGVRVPTTGRARLSFTHGRRSATVELDLARIVTGEAPLFVANGEHSLCLAWRKRPDLRRDVRLERVESGAAPAGVLRHTVSWPSVASGDCLSDMEGGEWEVTIRNSAPDTNVPQGERMSVVRVVVDGVTRLEMD